MNLHADIFINMSYEVKNLILLMRIRILIRQYKITFGCRCRTSRQEMSFNFIPLRLFLLLPSAVVIKIQVLKVTHIYKEYVSASFRYLFPIGFIDPFQD